jgi:PAS domain S-box-containing protein
MKDDNKTKKQLVHELAELRLQNAALEKTITGSISYELAAEEARRYAESIVGTVREPLLVLDANLKIISANRNFYSTFKVTPGETLGSFIYDLGNKQWDIPKLRELVEEVLPEKEAFDDFEVAHNFQDIGHKIMLLNARQIYRKDIGAKMILLAIEDITERKQLESLLIDSEEQYRRLFETASDGIVLLEKREGKITKANPATEKLLGYTEKESIGNKLQDIGVVLDTSDFQTTMQNLNKSGIINYRNVKVETKSGQNIDTEIYLVDRAKVVQCNIRDVTERKQTQKALKESEKKYRELYDFLPIPVYEMDLEANITSVNRAIYETFGGTEEDLKKGFKAWTLLSLEEIEKSKKNIQALLKGEQITGTEYTMMRLDGSVFPAIVISSVIYSDGKPVGLRGAIIDITDRKQAEESLRRSEEKYRTILENIEDGYYEVDLNGNFTFFNYSMCRILGYLQKEMMGMNNRQFTDKENAKKLFKTFNEVYKTGESAKEFDWQIIRKDGTKRYIEVSVSLQKNSSGQPIGFQGIARDITERKQAEDALRESEEKYRTILEDMDDVYFEVDIKGIVTFVNPSSCKMSGYSEEELLGMPFKKISAPDDIEKVMQYFGEIFLTDKTGKPFLWNLVKKNGEQGFFEIVVSLIRDKQGKPIGFQGIGRDVTERRKAEAVLQQTLDSLRKSVGATIQVMVSAVEMRDPYTSGHQLRSANLACAIATEMGLPQEKMDGIRMAGSIHDIGKLSIPAEILSKPTKLTNIEFSLIKEHSRSGYEMLKDVESPWPLAQIVYQHHERMDGSGYPRNLKGDEILIEARIMAVADVVEAMASHRPYRPGLGMDAALAEIEKNRGILYDNTVADACLKLFREKGYQLT